MTARPTPEPHGWFFPKHKWVLDEHEDWSSLFHRVRRHCSDCGKRQQFYCTFEDPIPECYWAKP